MIQNSQRMRMELLALGESLGWPRIPVGPGVQVRAGQSNWEKLARASMIRVAAALKNAKTRSANMGGGLDAHLTRVVTFDTMIRAQNTTSPLLVQSIDPATMEAMLKKERDRERMAKARAARKPKVVAGFEDA